MSNDAINNKSESIMKEIVLKPIWEAKAGLTAGVAALGLTIGGINEVHKQNHYCNFITDTQTCAQELIEDAGQEQISRQNIASSGGDVSAFAMPANEKLDEIKLAIEDAGGDPDHLPNITSALQLFEATGAYAEGYQTHKKEVQTWLNVRTPQEVKSFDTFDLN